MKKQLLTLIVEDEIDHCRQLEKLIDSNHPELNILGKCTSGNDALATLQTVKPDLLLLDIDLGDMSAFDLLEHLPEPDCQIVFVTSYNTFALHAFKAHAIDYLLKPVESKAFAKAIGKVLKQKRNGTDYQLLVNDFKKLSHQYLVLNEKQKVHYVPISDVLYLRSDGNYTIIHYVCKGQRYTHTNTACLATFETKLAEHGFMRIHQSYLISPDQIRVFDKRNNQIELACSDVLPVARNRRAQFDWRLGN